MKIAMAQISPSTGDLSGNTEKICNAIGFAKEKRCDLVIIPETAITGYMSCDLLEVNNFIDTNLDLLFEQIVPRCENIIAVVGFVDYSGKSSPVDRLFNTAAVIWNGQIVSKARKRNLCRYRYYDETRYFSSGESTTVTTLKIAGIERKVGILICEDLWDRHYPGSPFREAADAGAEMIVVINASPFETGKWDQRVALIRRHQQYKPLTVLYTNTTAIGDNLKDLILFDGRSMVIDRDGNIAACLPLFDEDLCIVELDHNLVAKKTISPGWSEEEELYYGLTFALKNYCRETGFSRVILGISGGIDSALCAALAADALGRENVLGIALPSKYSSQKSKVSAETLCRNIGIALKEISIEQLHEKVVAVFEKHRRIQSGVTDENIQARLRGLLLMALSNETGRMVIATGNKTELGLGYCTLYGDMVGGLLLIGDINKMQVYRLSEYINRRAAREIIPPEVIQRPPSAELSENQVDPFDYPVVSPLVDDLIARTGPEEIMEKYRTRCLGNHYPDDIYNRFGEETFRDIVTNTYRRYQSSAYKRSQSSPLVVVSRRALGFDLRETIINHWRPIW